MLRKPVMIAIAPNDAKGDLSGLAPTYLATRTLDAAISSLLAPAIKA